MGVKMDYRFKCPYCFEEMSHTEVLFRGVTIFRPEQFDMSGMGRSRGDIEIIPDDNERQRLITEYDRREYFSQKYDSVYHNWYSDHDFGATSENPGDDMIPKYDRPIIGPNDHGTSSLIYDEDGFAYKLRDPWNEETIERVCKVCHNPLPFGYGKYPVRYISVIGISGAGKTVYLSKLIQNLQNYTAKLHLATTPSQSTVEFVKKNPVREGSPLPAPTVRMQLEQPLSYNLKRNGTNETFVIYDIAGENCTDAAKMLKYGKFIQNSSGIILMMDPIKELGVDGGDGGYQELNKVLNNLNLLSLNAGYNNTPLAVCISKSDLMKDTLVSSKFFDQVRTQDYKFYAEDYNEISKELSEFLMTKSSATKVVLDEHYSFYNFFAFTTLGCATTKTLIQDEYGNEYEADVPKTPPNPKRIEEPLYWLFKQFGYITATGPIYTPRNEDLIRKKNELIEKIGQLQYRLSSYPPLTFGRKKKEKEALQEEIDRLSNEIAQVHHEIRRFAQ